MAAHGDMIRELVRRFNERAPVDVADYFAPDFQLDQAGVGPSRSGLDGARDMIDAVYALGSGIRLEILTLIEQDDHVAVRWQVTSDDPQGVPGVMMSMYRFVDGRIVDDWGVSARAAAWQR